MAKTKKKRKIIIRKSSSGFFNKEDFFKELDMKTRRIFQGMMFPLEQRMDQLFSLIQNVKSNVIVANTLLERKEYITKEEFLEEFILYEKHDVGVVDGEGKMDGNCVFSLYNMEN